MKHARQQRRPRPGIEIVPLIDGFVPRTAYRIAISSNVRAAAISVTMDATTIGRPGGIK
jgi:hypothetical protein